MTSRESITIRASTCPCLNFCSIAPSPNSLCLCFDFTGLQSLPCVEKTKNMRGKKPAATTQQNATQFKIKTGVKSTHDIIFKEDEVLVYRYTGVTTAEVVKDTLLNQAVTAVLDVCIKIEPITNSPFKCESSIPALFVKEKCQEAMGEVEVATGNDNTNEVNPAPALANADAEPAAKHQDLVVLEEGLAGMWTKCRPTGMCRSAGTRTCSVPVLVPY